MYRLMVRAALAAVALSLTLSIVTGQSVTGSGVTVAPAVLALPPAVQIRPALTIALSLACRPAALVELE